VLVERRELVRTESAHFAVAHDVQCEALELRAGAREVSARDRDLEVLVRSRLAAEKQVDREATDDAPRDAHARESARDLVGTPRVPGFERRSVPAHGFRRCGSATAEAMRRRPRGSC